MNRHLKKENDHRRFWLLLAVLLSLLFSRYALQVNIPRICFLVMIAVIAVLGNQAEIMALCISLIPLHESVDFYYSIVICIAAYVLKYYRRIRINLSVVLVLMMMVWELLHSFQRGFYPITFVTSVTPLIAIAILMSSDISELDYDFMVRALAVTAAATCVTLFGRVLYLSGFQFVKAVSTLRRLGLTWDESQKRKLTAGGEIHPNALGVISVLTSTGLLQIKSVGRSHKLDMLLVMIMLVFGTLTSSRTFLACLAMMILLLIVGQRGNWHQKVRFMGSIIVTIFVVLLLLSRFFPTLLEYYLGRFLVADLTTGRNNLMRVYHSFIVDNPDVFFFGVGLQDFGQKVTEIYRVARVVPHNSIQEIIIAWGLPGLLLFAALIAMIIRMARKHTPRHILLNYIPLIILLFKSMAGQLLTSSYSMLTLSYAYLSLCQDFTQRKER